MKCEKCGQEIKVNTKRKTMEIWKSINELLGLDWDKYEDTLRGTHTQKELIKLENAIKKIKTMENEHE